MVEVDGSDTTVRKTYSAGSTSLAVRTIVNSTENTLNWMLSDHLGSSSITTAADGTWNSEIRYSAFGETRYSSGITPTDYRYTGQLEQKDVNLYYYNARYYDAALGRFVQADTIIPSAGDAKSYDRYAYVNNNPVRYTDPTGHDQDCGINDPYCNNTKHEWVNSEWPEQLSYDVFWSAKDSYHYYYNNPEEAFTDMYLAEEEPDDTLYASMYSEYVLHSTFDPIPEFMYMDKLLLARQAGNAFIYFTIMGSMALGETFDQVSFGANFSEGVNSKNYDPGNSVPNHSGRWGAYSLKEQLAMEEVMADPLSNSIILPLKMNDTKRGWTEAEGWVKVSKTVNSVEIHFIYNTRTGEFADFKFN